MSDQPIVECAAGVLNGARDHDCEVFRGLRYAQPPIGPLRFRNPQPIKLDAGAVVDATRFGPAPPQLRPAYLSDVDNFDEDCLTLNVWRPRHRPGPLPVLVWVYGGGFKNGATAARIYDGRRLAAGGAIVISINYRVGALGFGTFAHRHPSLAEASNLGLKDVILALSWIQDHVATFGGDPERVTVIGQSAGAFLAGALLAASAGGLFRRLVMMSGGPYKIIDPRNAEDFGDQILIAAGVRPEDATAERLGRIAPDTWNAAVEDSTAGDLGDRNGIPIRGLAVVDDHHLPHGALLDHPMSAIRNGSADQVDILYTTTTAEATCWLRRGPGQFRRPTHPAELATELTDWGLTPDAASRIADHYLSRSDDLADARQRLLTDWIFHLPKARAAVAATARGGRSWIAMTSVPDTGPTGHFDDTPHLFGTAEDPSLMQQRFGVALRQTVLRFAKTGDPGWPVFTTPEGAIRQLSAHPSDTMGSLDQVLELWQEIDRP